MIKKLILLLLVVCGGVSAQAENVRIFIQPNSWADANATLKINLNKDGNNYHQVTLTNDNIFKPGIYFYDVDASAYNQFQFQRYSQDGNTHWNSTTQMSITSDSKFYIMGTVANDANTWTISSYLPNAYYFMSGTADSWAAVEKMMESGDTYSYTFSGVAYADKRISWAPGDSFNSDGSLKSWDNVSKSKTQVNNDDWITFHNFIYSNVDLGNSGSAWYVPSTTNQYNDGIITITFNSSNKSATISCQKNTTIGSAGYATYSNGEAYKVSGARAFTVSGKKGENSVSLVEMGADLIYPAGTGLILKGSGEVTINAVENGAIASEIGTNYLVGSGNSTVTPTSGSYIFNWNGSDVTTIGFYPYTTGALSAHKAYLDISSAAAPFLGFDFGGDTTGITEIGTLQDDGTIYSLTGVRLNKLQKGVNIVNGKKIVVK